MRRLKDFARDTRGDCDDRDVSLDFPPLDLPAKAPSLANWKHLGSSAQTSDLRHTRGEITSQLSCYRKFHRSSSQLFNGLKQKALGVESGEIPDMAQENTDDENEGTGNQEEPETLESLLFVFEEFNKRLVASRSVSLSQRLGESDFTTPIKSHGQGLPQPVLSPSPCQRFERTLDPYTATEGTDHSSDQQPASLFDNSYDTELSTPETSEAAEPQLRFCPEVELVVYQRKYPLMKSNKWPDILRLKSRNARDGPDDEWIPESTSKPILKSRRNHNAEKEMATVRREDQVSVDAFMRKLDAYDTLREDMQDRYAQARDHVIYRYNRSVSESSHL